VDDTHIDKQLTRDIRANLSQAKLALPGVLHVSILGLKASITVLINVLLEEKHRILVIKVKHL
jgi:hypothetical protein